MGCGAVTSKLTKTAVSTAFASNLLPLSKEFELTLYTHELKTAVPDKIASRKLISQTARMARRGAEADAKRGTDTADVIVNMFCHVHYGVSRLRVALFRQIAILPILTSHSAGTKMIELLLTSALHNSFASKYKKKKGENLIWSTKVSWCETKCRAFCFLVKCFFCII